VSPAIRKLPIEPQPGAAIPFFTHKQKARLPKQAGFQLIERA
jgi:hypothetical protein